MGVVRLNTFSSEGRLAAELESTRKQFDALLQHAPLGVYLIDADFRIRDVNPIALSVFGDIPGGVTGRDFAEIIHILWKTDYADEVVSIVRHTLETGEPYVTPERAELRIDRGVIEHYEWRVDRIPLPDGRNGVVCYFRDISDQVRARKAIEDSREALRESDRRKDEFLAILSHELRNPLAPLRNALHVLRRAEIDGSAPAPIHEMMERQVNHLVRLVDDLLEMSRITRGTLELRKERVDLVTIVRNAIETTEHLIEARGHRLTRSLPDQAVWVEGDPVRLAQVVANLLSNAAKYTDSGGQIAVEVVRNAGAAIISVRDSGVGIGPEALPHVFEMFHRGDRRSGQDGLGIGLTLARRLVEMHGGTITANSEGLATGSEFTVRLPLTANQQSAHAGDTRPSATVAQQRVLVVDDNHDAADSLRYLLEMFGADVRVARGGEEALNAVADYNPAVVLLDIGMPGMDGYEVARHIHARFKDHRPTIVAITGWGQPADRQRAREAGFDHHLVKPADIGVLQQLLRSLDRPACSQGPRGTTELR